jgi:hypothetical protein
MFCGFNLNIDMPTDDGLYNCGRRLYDKHKLIGKTTLKTFENTDGSLNASLMTANWFPVTNADIFISHSHKNIEHVITFAGWLFQTFKLTSFIDSCIWGYADDLLKLIDKKYCKNDGSSTYNYRLRNFSTSHVHMMLTTALTGMIDSTECLFFFNTPESICPSDVVNETLSPWIYSEISMSRLIRKRKLSEHRGLRRVIAESDFSKAQARLEVKYDVPLAHLYPLDSGKLSIWEEEFNCDTTQKPLDILYKSVGKTFD